MTDASDDLSSFSMEELFRVESENQAASMSRDLLALEHTPTDPALLEQLMRAAHSVKGAARIVGMADLVTLGHAMEDCFVAAQKGHTTLTPARTSVLLEGVDIFEAIGRMAESGINTWLADNHAAILSLAQRILESLNQANDVAIAPPAVYIDAPVIEPGDKHTPDAAPAPLSTPPDGAAQVARPPKAALLSSPAPANVTPSRKLRLSVQDMDRLMGLSGEAVASSRWIKPFSDDLLRIKRAQVRLSSLLDEVADALPGQGQASEAAELLRQAQSLTTDLRETLSTKLAELGTAERRTSGVAQRLHREITRSRMTSFQEGVHGFQRMVRDVSAELGKQVTLQITGLDTQVDRDILERIEAPLNHLIRNAIDHGIELPEVRARNGKPSAGTIRLTARHAAGRLEISVSDDGQGVDLDRLRAAILDKHLSTPEMIAAMGTDELIEFLFLPAFSMKGQVTEISGRGVGLDIVLSTIQELRGTLRSDNRPGDGVKFTLQLPLTLSLIKALIVEIGGQAYGLPLAYLDHTLRIDKRSLETIEGHTYTILGKDRIGLAYAHQILACSPPPPSDWLDVVVISDRKNRYGLVVDRFMGQRSLVLQPLDERLGKVKDISAGTILDNGDPALILDVEDLVRSIDSLVQSRRLSQSSGPTNTPTRERCKRVLVVEDSFTVREVERKLIAAKGYQVEVAVDGMEGWNALRTGQFDLVVTDVDMPRMNGIELVERIRSDSRLRPLPVMIVSYKDREEDRIRGMQAGADYYFAKSTFNGTALLDAVHDLIGAP